MEQGNFILEGNSFLAGKKKFVIRKRKKQTGKPELYLIQLEPFQYVSSLFPVPCQKGNQYTFDFQKQLYRLVMNDNQVIVETI